MNYKNYKIEVCTLIQMYKDNTPNYPDVVNDIEDAIKLINDEECLNTEFLDSIWTYYCKEMPRQLCIALFAYTSFKSQKINWNIAEHPDIIFMDNIQYKISLPGNEVNEIGIPCQSDNVFSDVIDIPVIFDLNTKQWYISSNEFYGTSNTYSYECCKKLCLMQWQLDEDKRIAKEMERKAKQESKRKEKELLKEKKRKEKEQEKEIKKQNKLKQSITKASEKQQSRSRKKAAELLYGDNKQLQIQF